MTTKDKRADVSEGEDEAVEWLDSAMSSRGSLTQLNSRVGHDFDISKSAIFGRRGKTVGSTSVSRDNLNVGTQQSFLQRNMSKWKKLSKSKEAAPKLDWETYRADLFHLMDTAELNRDEKSLVFFLAAMTRNKDKMIRYLEVEPNSDERINFAKVKHFLETMTVQYAALHSSEWFSVVLIPNTMPGADLLWFCTATEPPVGSRVDFFARTTAAQLSLDHEAQAFAKKVYEECMVRRNRRKDSMGLKTADAQAKEQLARYNAFASDASPLLYVDWSTKSFKVWRQGGPYSLEDIDDYMSGGYEDKGETTEDVET